MPDRAQPRVVVLMATFNGAPWVSEQIASILAADGVDVHIYLSDDGSQDDTVAIARQAGGTRLTVLPEHQRLGAAQNFIRLVQESPLDEFDYVALSDQDDLWRSDKLPRAINCLGGQGADAYSSNVTAFWPDGREHLIRKSYPQRRWDHLFEYGSAGSTFVFPVATALKLRALLVAADPTLLARVDAHDWLFYALLRAAGLTWRIEDYSGVAYRQHAQNHRGALVGLAAMGERLRRLRSGWYREQVLTMADLTGADCPVVDYLREPRLADIAIPLRHFRDCRRRPRDAAILLGLLIGAALSPNGSQAETRTAP